MESAAFCHHASHFIRTIVFLVIIALPSNTSETSWYQGCVLPDGESFNLQISNASSPALCSAACLAQGYEYAAVHGDSQCGCLHQLSRLKLVQSVSCNVSCSSFPNLACGGATGWSAYSTSALYLLNVSVRAERRVVMGERTVLEAEARLAAAAVNGSREVENGMADVSFVWSVGGAAVPSRAPPGSSRAVSRLIRRFDEPGNYSVGVIASNGVSRAEAWTLVRVLPPAPSTLLLELSDAAAGDHPSCIPAETVTMETVTVDDARRIVVFAGREARLRASVATGVNVTFHWRFSVAEEEEEEEEKKEGEEEEGGGRALLVQRSDREECRGLACLVNEQKHTFAEVGLSVVRLRVYNSYGSVEQDFNIVAVASRLSDLTIDSPADHLVRLPDAAVLRLSLYTTSRRTTRLSLDFGDGRRSDASLRDDAGEDAGRRVATTTSYGVGCRLHVSVEHEYDAEGVYNITARAYNVAESAYNVAAAAEGASNVAKNSYNTTEGPLNAHNSSSAAEEAAAAAAEEAEEEARHTLTVMRELRGAEVRGDRAVAAGAPARLTLHLQQDSAFKRVAWYVADAASPSLRRLAETSATLVHAFPDVGVHRVGALASNALGEARADFVVVDVQRPISGLAVTAAPRVAARGSQVALTAALRDGTGVEFAWEVAGGDVVVVGGDGRSETARVVYERAGAYAAAVTAANSLGRVTARVAGGVLVQDPVAGLALVAPSHAPAGAPTRVVAAVAAGTNVSFVFEADGEIVVGDGGAAAVVTFAEVGERRVSVRASNGVSSLTETAAVAVLRRFDGVTVEAVGEVVARRRSVFVAKLDGILMTTPDIVFVWDFPGNSSDLATMAPMASGVFSEPGEHTVAVTTVSAVGEMRATLTVDVREESEEEAARLEHEHVARVGRPLDVKVVTSGGDVGPVTYSFGDGTLVTSSSTNTVSHVYDSVGVYELSAHLEGVAAALPSVVSVQAPIEGLQIHGPSAVEMGSAPVHSRWEAVVESGSDILYTWEVNGTVTQSPYNAFSHVFHETGVFRVSVSGENALGSSSPSPPATAIVHVQRPIVEVRVVAPATALRGRVVEVVVEVVGGGNDPITVTTTYGDEDEGEEGETTILLGGEEKKKEDEEKEEKKDKEEDEEEEEKKEDEVSTTIVPGGDAAAEEEEEQAKEKEVESTIIPSGKEERGRVAVRVFTLPHAFSRAGSRSLRVRAYNRVSSVAADRAIVVEEPVSGLVVTATVARVVPILRDVVAVATIDAGTDVAFAWDFGEPFGHARTRVVSNATASEAQHTYGLAGIYVIKVRARSPADPAPVEARLPYAITVAEPISGVRFLPTRGQVAPLRRVAGRGDGYTSNYTSFTVVAERGSDVTFVLDYGDGSTQTLLGLFHPAFGHQFAEGRHRYTREGAYVVTATAQNILGEVLAPAVEFHAQVAPTDLRLNDTKFFTRLGDATRFAAVTSAGTNLTFDWSFGDESDVIGRRARHVSHRYLVVGDYSVRVRAYNLVGEEIVSALVYVESPVQGVELRVGQMLYATQQKIELTAVSETDAPRWYAWHMGDARRDNVNTVSPTRHYAYDLPGRYVVQVLAVNHISNASSQPVELVLQTAVSELSIVHAGSALRGNATTLRVRFTGSDLTLEWNFGDGHAATVTQQNTSVNHTFDRIGEYEVSVKAYNDISTAKATLTLFVVERPCKTPAISFGLLGTDSSHHTFERATSVVIEPVVTIECSMTEVANFQWSLYHRLNSSQLSPPGLDKATLQQRVLYLDKNLLHYGDYRAMLKVKMNGTFVYTMTEVNFSVVASPLQSVIGGGRQRNVSRQDVLELNASASHDPDFPRDASFSYRWTCQPLHTPTAPCFRDGHELPRNATDPVLRLPAATFASEHSSFLVKVTAEKPGRRSRVASQLLQLNDDAAAAATLEILVDCKACENGYVNDDDVPAFSAICPRCDENNVDYLWSVYVVADGHQTVRSSRCYQTDASQPDSFLRAGVDSSGKTAAAVSAGETASTHPAPVEATPLSHDSVAATTTATTTTTMTHDPAASGGAISPFPPFGFIFEEASESDTRPREPTEGAGVDARSREPTEGVGVDARSQEPTEGAGINTRLREPTEGAGVDARPREPTEGAGVDARLREPTEGAGVDARLREPTEGAGIDARPQEPTEGAGVHARLREPPEGAGIDARSPGRDSSAGVPVGPPPFLFPRNPGELGPLDPGSLVLEHPGGGGGGEAFVPRTFPVAGGRDGAIGEARVAGRNPGEEGRDPTDKGHLRRPAGHDVATPLEWGSAVREQTSEGRSFTVQPPDEQSEGAGVGGRSRLDDSGPPPPSPPRPGEAIREGSPFAFPGSVAGEGTVGEGVGRGDQARERGRPAAEKEEEEEEEEEGRPIAARRGERRGSQASTGERPTEDPVPFLPFAAIGEGELPTSEHPRSRVVGEGELPTSEHPLLHVVGEGEPPTSEHPRPLVVAEGELPTSEHPRPLIVAEGRPSATEEPGGTFARGRGLAGEEVVDFAEGPANGFLEGSSGRWLFPAEPSFLPAGGPAEGGVKGRFDVRRRSEVVPAGSRRGAFADMPEEDVAEHDFVGGDFMGPVEGSFRLPVEGIPIQPGEESHRQPIEGSFRQPVEGSHRQPIEGSFRQPVEGISRQPVEGSLRQPVEGTFRQPVEGTFRQPVEGILRQPVEGISRQPVEGTFRQPVEGSFRQPVEGSFRQPVEGTFRQPVEGIPRQPVEGISRQPVDGIPRQPVEGIFRQPAGGSGIAGEASDARGAGSTSDVPRWPLAPPPSFLFEGEGESYPSATRRGFASVEGSRRSKRQAGYVPFSSSNSGGDPMGILVVEENHGPVADGERRPFDARMPIYNSDFLSEEEPSEREDSKLPGGFPLVAPWFDIAGEGAPGESGSAAARDLSQLPTSLPAVPNEGATEGKGPRRQDKDNDVAGYGRDASPDLVQAEQYGESETRVTPHALSLTRIRLKLKHEATLTGNASRTFVMRGGGGVLQQGSTYVVQVSVTDKINGNQSSALTYFSVNKGPRFGKCTVQPEVGVELETEFKVHCMEWKDKNLPLWYEISYALADNEPRQLIYYGFHHEAKFLLPSGTEDRNNSVSVRVAVRDSIGGRTSVCAMSVAVLPANETALNINHLAAMTQGAGGRLRTYVAHGDEYAARHYAAASARTLDRLAETARDKDAGKEEEGEEDAAQASAVRAALLGVVAELPLRTEFDCLQAVTDLAAITSAPRQLTPATLKLAIDFLKAVVTRVADEATDRLDGDFVHLFGTAASNILRGVVETQPGAWLAKRVMSSVELSVTKLIRVELGYRTQDEKPFNLTTPFVSVLASRYVVATATTLAADHAAFTLPQQMLGSRHGNGTDGCYEAHMLTFHQDPFGWGKNPVESEVASLTVYTCDGEEVVVKDLSPRQQVTMEIPRQHTENEVEADFVLGKERMNIHQFNVTVDNFVHSLHIVLHMHGARDSSQDGGRLFPISLLLSYDSPPTPDNYEVRQDFEVGEKELRLFLPVGALNVSGPYYLGIVDGTFNAGRPRGDEVQAQTYTLQLWFGQCLYFDDGLDMWSDKGCLPMESSTYTATHCRCNHLTAFGASFLTPQMTFMTVEVESFFRLNENALSYGLLVAALLCYALVFALCARADLHDATKPRPVHLVDNSAKDKQTYRIVIETGRHRGAGTTAKVSLILHGEQGMSETRELVSSDGQPLFERQSCDTFIMTTPRTLGCIWKVQLWHNNAGISPSWYLSRVTVEDANAARHYYFECEKWYAVEENDGKVEREVMVAQDFKPGFRKVFWYKALQYFSDYHVWLSVYARPPLSPFTRVQRLGCCLALCLSNMALTAAWYQHTHQEYRGEFTLLDVSWQAVLVGLVSCFTVQPINLLLQLLFRRSRRKGQVRGERRSSSSSGEVASDNRSPDPASFPPPPQQHTPSYVLDHSLQSWVALQEWAQRLYAKHEAAERRRAAPSDAGDTWREAGRADKPGGNTGVEIESGFEDCVSQDQAAMSAGGGGGLHNSTLETSSVESGIVVGSHERVRESVLRRKRRRVVLPSFMLYIAWTLCAAVVVAAAYLTVLYSYRFGKTRTVLWLQSLYFSLLICIFCVHPVIVLITSVCTAVRHRNNMDVFLHHDRSFRDDSQEAVAKAAKAEQEQEDVDSADDDDIGKGIAARQRSRYLRFARPPPERQLLEAREQTMKEKQTFRIVGDVVGYALLLATVAAVAFARDRSHMQRLNESVRAAFVRTPVMAFTDIRSPPDWWTWSNTGLLQGLFPDPHTSKGLQPIVDGTSVLIGQATLRQLRVVAGEACAAGNDTCHHDDDDDDDAAAVRYGPSDLWSFTSGRLLRRHVLRGRHGNYGSGGYVVKISKNREEAKQQLSKLEAGGWIDAKTRAVVVEFTVYNPATNLFSCVSLLLELTSAGVCATLPLVDAVQLYMYGATVRDRLRWVAELAFVAAVLYAAKTEIYRALKWRRKYRDSFWNCVQVVFLAVSVGWIVCYVYRFVLLRGALEHLHMTSHDVYLDLSTVAIWEQVLNALIGIIMFLLIVKALRLFRYNTTLAKFGHIYKAASKELVFYATLFLVLLTAYGQIGVLCFGGAPSGGFRSFPAALGTLLDVVTRNGGVRPLLETSRVVAPIYVGSFVTLVFLLLSAMIKAILNLEYGKYTATSSIPLAYREMGIILWNRMIDYIFAFCCGDDGDGDDDDDTYKTKEDYPVPAELTLAEVQYQVDELLYRMSNISGPLGSSTTDVYPESLTLSDCPGDSEVLHSPDEEAVELKVEKIRQHLLSHDPELAQLLLQNTADLPDDKERDLRSQLELEILRILQGQHGRRDDVSEHSFEIPDETGQAGGYTASRWASEREPVSPAAIPRDAPPPPTTTPRQPTVLICRYDDSNSCSSKSHGSSSSHGPKSTSSQDNAQEPYRPVKAARTPQCRLSVPAAATQDGGGVGDSSSGSDVEALRQARRSATQHRLRKTKSRGKGKGRHAALLSDVDLAALRFCSTDSEPELSSRRRQHPSSAEETTTL